MTDQPMTPPPQDALPDPHDLPAEGVMELAVAYVELLGMMVDSIHGCTTGVAFYWWNGRGFQITSHPPEVVVDALRGEQKWVVAHDDPTPYMDGPRTTRLREVGDYEQAEAMLEILAARSEKAPRQNLHIETRWVTPWEEVKHD